MARRLHTVLSALGGHAAPAGLGVLLSLLSVCAGLAGCADEEAEEAEDPDVPGRTTNPDGVPYPTDRIGPHDRVGKNPGDRIPNFTFQGYPDADRSRGLQPISLADYFDPQQKRNKVLHIQVAATWCSICRSVVEATNIAKEPLGKRGMAYLEVVVSGPTQGIGPSLPQFDEWLTQNKTTFTSVLDVRARRLASIGVNGDVMPWDIVIDTRTMEILDSSGGAPADIGLFANEFLAFVEKNPPSY
jgi:hypothetical protein